MRKLYFTLLLSVVLFSNLTAQVKEPKVILITLDGLRWQELYGGADSALIAHEEFVEDTVQLKELFAARTKELRREKLMPFFWNTIAQEGSMYGNKYENSEVELTNTMHFSYPGYNEILTGFADDINIQSNDKNYNKNVTILEKLNNDPQFKNSVQAFASWDVFDYIINDKRSGIPVNSGYRHSLSQSPSERELFLNKLQDETPQRWHNVRFDVFTHNYALEALKNEHPRVVYISYGETDDYAHDGRYDHYLKSAHNTDKMIQEIWKYVQEDPFYKNQTTLIITTDHGRGWGANSGKQSWRHHGTDIEGSEYTWIVMLGNRINSKGVVKDGKTYYANQIANTVAELLNFSTKEEKMGDAIPLD